MADIHNYKKRLERTLERIKKSKEISSHNKKLILGYYRNCVVEGLSVAKTERYLYDAFRLAQFYQKKLDKATEEELKDLVASIESKEWSLHTKYTFKIGLRKFYKFIDGIIEKGVSPQRLRWMKTNLKKCQVKLPEDLLTQEEVVLMIRNALSKRNKALVSCLYESGCRIGELCSLRIKDVRFDEYGALLQVFGKTGSRVVRIVQSSSYLLDWINDHPSGERDDFIWVSNKNILLSDSQISNIIKAIARRSGIKKRVWIHGFRHSRATHLANYLTESNLKNFFGWTQASDMASVYVHLNGKDSDKAILKMNGIEVNEEKKKKEFEKKQCSRCKTINAPTNKFCSNCAFVLDEEVSKEILQKETTKKDMDELLNELIEDKSVLDFLVKKAKEKELAKYSQ